LNDLDVFDVDPPTPALSVEPSRRRKT